jgi:hypothetical protein
VVDGKAGGCIAVITKAQIMPLLLEAGPSFAPEWEKYCEDWGEEYLLYPSLGEFAHHLVNLMREGRTEEFPAVFDVCERLHLEGDPDVQIAATIGMLESIQIVAGNSGVDPEVFRGYLRPESLKWWQALNDFWSGKIDGVYIEEPGGSAGEGA